MPADGSQRSVSAKTMISMMPVQNTGRLTPVTATPMLRRSSQEYCRVAETMPAGTPIDHARPAARRP